MLTQERVRELFDYREDGSLIWKVSRGSAAVGAVAGWADERGYRRVFVGGKVHLGHRIVFLYHHGYMPENYVDHVDRDPRNNRIENLREVSHSCNLRNAEVNVANTSGVVGVSWYEVVRRWRAQIKVQSKMIYLGTSEDFTEAVAQRLAAEQCLGWEVCHSSTSAYLYMQDYLRSL